MASQESTEFCTKAPGISIPVRTVCETDPDLVHPKLGKRDWTYQEHLASSTLLFFTDFGIYNHKRLAGAEGIETNTEGLSRDKPRFERDDSVGNRIMMYSSRTLTYRSDILRAFSGILYAAYGDRTSFGVPWEHFDRIILWPDLGPSNEQQASPPRSRLPLRGRG